MGAPLENVPWKTQRAELSIKVVMLQRDGECLWPPPRSPGWTQRVPQLVFLCCTVPELAQHQLSVTQFSAPTFIWPAIAADPPQSWRSSSRAYVSSQCLALPLQPRHVDLLRHAPRSRPRLSELTFSSVNQSFQFSKKLLERTGIGRVRR